MWFRFHKHLRMDPDREGQIIPIDRIYGILQYIVFSKEGISRPQMRIVGQKIFNL